MCLQAMTGSRSKLSCTVPVVAMSLLPWLPNMARVRVARFLGRRFRIVVAFFAMFFLLVTGSLRTFIVHGEDVHNFLFRQ